MKKPNYYWSQLRQPELQPITVLQCTKSGETRTVETLLKGMSTKREKIVIPVFFDISHARYKLEKALNLDNLSDEKKRKLILQIFSYPVNREEIELKSFDHFSPLELSSFFSRKLITQELFDRLIGGNHE